MNCGICDRERPIVGVYATSAPYSLGFCQECLDNHATDPECFFEMWFNDPTDILYHLDRGKQLRTFSKGKYISWQDWKEGK
jgi:hypothetical protein